MKYLWSIYFRAAAVPEAAVLSSANFCNFFSEKGLSTAIRQFSKLLEDTGDLVLGSVNL